VGSGNRWGFASENGFTKGWGSEKERGDITKSPAGSRRLKSKKGNNTQQKKPTRPNKKHSPNTKKNSPIGTFPPKNKTNKNSDNEGPRKGTVLGKL